MDHLFKQWADSEGKPYIQKLTGKTEPQRQRQLKGYFKTYCDTTFGGLLWYKMVIALGDVPCEAVDAANDVVRLRVRESSTREAGTASRPQCPR